MRGNSQLTKRTVPLLQYKASRTMNKNPLNKGILTEIAIGIGTVTPKMLAARARELAAIANYVPPQPPQVDYEQKGSSDSRA